MSFDTAGFDAQPTPVVSAADESAEFAEWVRPHWAAMAALAARAGQDGEDLLQNALTQAWRKRRHFDPSKGTARNWLLALTADQRRKHWLRVARITQVQIDLTDRANSPTESVSPRPEAAWDLENAILQLSKRQRLAVDLHYYLDLSITDCAAVMRCAPGTVKSTLADARTRLLDLLGKDYR